MDGLKKDMGVKEDSELTGGDLRNLCKKYKAIYVENNKVFPEDPYEQLYNAIFAVFDSWTSSRAIKFRQVCVCAYLYMSLYIYKKFRQVCLYI
jgi:pyruvate,orthophosphate dikinase